MLSEIRDSRLNSDRLASLFRIGDERIADLIRALDDVDQAISIRSQLVIRYLGNEKGMNALREWYSRQRGEYRIIGSVPLPLNEWDYNFIRINYISEPAQTWGERGAQYIYSLALDESPRAKEMLDEIIKNARNLNESNFVGRAIKCVQASQPQKLLVREKDLAKLVLSNAFFITPEDRKYTSARFVAFNGAKDKALIEVYINRGHLAEEWYHVVINRREPGWRFFSIYQVAIS